MAARKKSGRGGKVESLRIKGFVRAALTDVKTGKVTMGDWHENAITADGFQNYICNSIGSGLSGKQLGWLQLASQTAAPSSSQTAAAGEFEARKSSSNSTSANGTLQGTASWATNEATQSNVGAVAWYNTSSGGTAGSVATFSSSTKTTDQTLSITYQWRFS